MGCFWSMILFLYTIYYNATGKRVSMTKSIVIISCSSWLGLGDPHSPERMFLSWWDISSSLCQSRSPYVALTHTRVQLLTQLLSSSTSSSPSSNCEQWVVWVAEPLDLIRDAPKWIREEIGAHTGRNYVTFPPDRLLTLSLQWRTRIHTWVHTPEG